MERLAISPRANLAQKLESQGFLFHGGPDSYWNENACYRFASHEIDRLEAATEELYRISLLAVERVISRNLFSELHIPEKFIPLIRSSWERHEFSLYGRFDLWFDGEGIPKLYEFNADTPTSLFEAAVIQWTWLQEVFPEKDQFNSIHEKLIEQWKRLGVPTMHFACIGNIEEDFATTVYLEDTALQAGIKGKRLFIHEIGWNGREFVDLENQPIKTLFKLYPWEWLLREEFSVYLPLRPCRMIEPAWKMILSNKGILPILWKLFYGHENLLPAYTTPENLGSFVRKPFFGREGKGVEFDEHSVCENEPVIYQEAKALPDFGGNFPVIGSWVIGEQSAGMGIRESDTPITTNTSRFVPHYFE
jgi:glutathionylspermidine synthase